MSNSFTIEGLELRIKQKLISEDSPQSNAFTVDFTRNAKIIGFEDGRLYFQDNEITNPIPLSKIDQFFEHITTNENGELIFYSSDFDKFVTLTQLTSEVNQISKKNALVYSNMTRFGIENTFKSYDFMDDQYKRLGESFSGTLKAEIEALDFSTAYPTYKSNLIDNNFINELINNFVNGINAIVLTGFTPSNYVNEETINSKAFIINDDVIGFKPQENDLIGKVYYAGKSLTEFDQYVFGKLYKFNDVGRWLYGKIGSMTFASGIDNYRDVIFNEAAKAVSSIIITRYVRAVNQVLADQGAINPDTENFREQSEIASLSFDTIFSLSNTEFLSNATDIKNEVDARLAIALGDVEASILNLVDFSDVTLGGKLDVDDFYSADFSVFNKVWFDIPGLHVPTNKIGQDMGMSCIASLNVDMRHSQNVRYEFRLFDSVAQVELDRVVLDTLAYNQTRFIGDIFEPHTETVPIQLNYFGPIPDVQCTDKAYQECFSNLDVKSYPRINSDEVIIDQQISEEFRIISDRVEKMNPVVNKNQDIITLHTPRIIRVQWRIIVDSPDEYLKPHKDAVANISFNQYSPNSADQDISINVYNFGKARDKSVIKQGITSFIESDSVRVEGDFTNNSGSDYSINLAGDRNIQLWYVDKDKNGFTIKANKEFTGEVSWVVTNQTTFSDNTREGVRTELPECLVDYQPEYSDLSNFDIFLQSGYQVNLIPEQLSEQLTGDTDTSLPDPEIEVDLGFQTDLLGVECSTDCINDCPSGYNCSGACPGAELTESGCACCECFDDTQCPEGMICDGLGNCV